ncbi:NAD(P)-dependent oxidoreductase [Microbacterium sp. RD1]|uniref:NAD(P)-dependent oxidoreductase n=1 Tax=Microbacterium sp. RD1 TaxID=3457313 RepID=UPI003FA57B6C
MRDIGFIGLGTMGLAMCRRLVEAGHDVAVWNRTPRVGAELVALGGRRVLLEEALGSAVVFSMLSNDAAAEAVFSEENLRLMPAGSVHVGFESLSLAAADSATARHAAAGVDYVAAPVIGRPPVAAAGQLNILLAGKRAAADRVEPLLAELCSRTWYLGDRPRLANLVKICVNYNLIHTLQALSESVAIAERGGVDPALLVELLNSTLYPGPAYGGYGREIAARRYEPVGFSVELGLKDLSLAEQAAAETGTPLPTAPVLREMFERTLAEPDIAELDWAAIAEIVRRERATS